MPDISFASLARRFAAGVVDSLFVLPFFGGALFLFSWRAALWAIPVAAALASAGLLFWVLNGIVLLALRGQTVGDMALGIRVVFVDRPQQRAGVGFVTALVRTVSQTGISPVFLLGFLWVLVDDRLHRAWHDIFAGTIMVRATEQGTPLIPRHRFREAVGAVVGALGTLVLFTPVLVIVFVQVLAWFTDATVVHVSPNTGTVTSTLATIPSDFPSELVIPAVEHIREVLSSTPTADKRRVVIVWRDLPADPVSTVLAYKTSFSLLGFTTTIEYLADGPHLHFVNSAGTIQGELTVVPTDDAKQVRELRIAVTYPRSK
ncbi:RDD family protein [Patescibacteria group bacterium]|nr:RDD family protein [Patescibacteria group bacterium]